MRAALDCLSPRSIAHLVMNMKVQDVRLNHVLPSAAAPLCTYCTPPIALCVVEGAVESQHAISDLLLEICTQYIDEKALHSVTPPVIKQFSLIER